MKNIIQIFCFFLIIDLFIIVHSTHHLKLFQKANKPLSLQQFESFVKSGIPIIDTRHIPQNGIIKGSYWISQNANVPQLLSFILKPESQFIIVSNEPKRNETISGLIQRGFKNILGYNNFDLEQWREKLLKPQIKKLDELDKTKQQAFIDVRTEQELLQRGKIKNSLWLPIQEFQSRFREVQEFIKKNNGSQIVIHCELSPRARLGASIVLNKDLGPITVLNETIEALKHILIPFSNQDL